MTHNDDIELIGFATGFPFLILVFFMFELSESGYLLTGVIVSTISALCLLLVVGYVIMRGQNTKR